MISQMPVGGPAGWPDGPPGHPVRSGAVPPLADGFSTRPETAPNLGAALAPGATAALVPARAATTGVRDWLGTCGKTQLAAYAAESLWQSGVVSLLVWVVASNRASVLTGYAQAALAVLGSDTAQDTDTLAAVFVSWLAETSQPWLVVLDDLTAAADLAGLWPGGPAGRVLITAASPGLLPAEAQARVLPVGPFSPREALSYLMGRLTADTDQRLGAIDLVAELGNEPLALAQASGVVASSALSCRDYRGYFVDRRAQLTEIPAAKPPAAAVTWRFSVEQADRLAPGGAVQPLLALAGLLDGHGIPSTVFSTRATTDYLSAAGRDGRAGPDPARDALLVLERTGLLDIDPSATPPVIRMSTVIQDAVQAATPAPMRDRAVRVAADALLAAWPADEQDPWLAGCLRGCTASLQQAGGKLLLAGGCHPVLLRAGQSLDGARLTGPAVAYWRALAGACETALGATHPETQAVDERLAGAYLAAGRPAEAVSWFERVVASRVKVLGPDHPGAAAARRDLGQALMAAHQFPEAITVLARTVAEYQRLCGPDHPDTLGARDELAAAYRAAGQFGEAIPLQRQILSDRERTQGARHPDTLTTREELADTYLADGRVKDAISHYKRVLSDRERVLGRDHLDTIAGRGKLGAGYYSAGRMASAVQLYEQTVAGYGQVLGPDHPDTLARCLSLATAYYAVGRLTDAQSLLRETLARCDRALPPGDQLTQVVRDSLTNVASASGQPR
ncbi:MAG TPA: tetratricopeptide repeat protein [Streptosporangiaceae bacterium]|nr:tetratricopeptide repeat protein [Streptosporangiaceae bacterium]